MIKSNKEFSKEHQDFIESLFVLSRKSKTISYFKEWFKLLEQQYNVKLFSQVGLDAELDRLEVLENCLHFFKKGSISIDMDADNTLKVLTGYIEHLKQQEDTENLAFAIREVLLAMPYFLSDQCSGEIKKTEELITNYAFAIKSVHEVLLKEFKISNLKLDEIIEQQSKKISDLGYDIDN